MVGLMRDGPLWDNHVTQTYSSIYIVRNNIARPPGGLMLIWLSRVIADLSILVVEWLRRAPVVWPLLVTATLAVAAICVAGTYPLAPVLPAKNVARPGSVQSDSRRLFH